MSRPGDISGREINVVTINADLVPSILTIDGGYKICLRAPRNRAVVRHDTSFEAPGVCAPFTLHATRASFTIPKPRSCELS